MSRFRATADKICPYCAGIIPAMTTVCGHCAKSLLPEKYEIAPDGMNFGILHEGKNVIHGLALAKALGISDIMNSIHGL